MKRKLSDEILSIVHAFSDRDRKDAIRGLASRVKSLEERHAALWQLLAVARGALYDRDLTEERRVHVLGITATNDAPD